jgi:NADH-quinone oxidoreductase subunit L
MALMGLPILNGFWSKELVLEAGLEGGPGWIYALMVVGAGLTALYTFRCVWMVFYAQPKDASRRVHDAGPAMRTALYPLAFGSLTTWLLAGPFSSMLAQTLPFHEIEAATTLQFVTRILSAPATYLALLVVAVGLIMWWQRDRLALLSEPLQGLGRLAEHSFGFEAINHGIVQTVQTWAEDTRGLQTGLLNWNVAGIVIGLVVVLVIVMGA